MPPQWLYTFLVLTIPPETHTTLVPYIKSASDQRANHHHNHDCYASPCARRHSAGRGRARRHGPNKHVVTRHHRAATRWAEVVPPPTLPGGATICPAGHEAGCCVLRAFVTLTARARAVEKVGKDLAILIV
eukprot:329259-Chlamydomonas_euryale.AAC.2